MKLLVICLVALGIGCATSRPAAERETARATPPDPVAGPSNTTALEAAAKYALTTYVDESTRTHGVVCVELDGHEDPGKVLDRLSPLAGRLSVDRKDCLGRDEPSAILSIGPPQLAGDRARVDVGVVLGSAGMLELERRQGTWEVVRVTRPWVSLR
jgi:hypothetical protein